MRDYNNAVKWIRSAVVPPPLLFPLLLLPSVKWWPFFWRVTKGESLVIFGVRCACILWNLIYTLRDYTYIYLLMCVYVCVCVCKRRQFLFTLLLVPDWITCRRLWLTYLVQSANCDGQLSLFFFFRVTLFNLSAVFSPPSLSHCLYLFRVIQFGDEQEIFNYLSSLLKLIPLCAKRQRRFF